MENVNGRVFNSYYNTKGVREVCHILKNRDCSYEYYQAVINVSDYMIDIQSVCSSDFLIPAPQHTGYSEYTLDISNRISQLTGAKVLDILGRRPSATLYDMKRQGIRKPCLDLFLKTSFISHGGGRLFFVDNVISTGITFNTANMLVNGDLIPLVYAVDETVYLCD